MVLLIDQVNATFTQVAFARDAIEQFLKKNGGKLCPSGIDGLFSPTQERSSRSSIL